MSVNENPAEPGRDFIRDIVEADIAARRQAEIVTRFPPEPNGYLHIGHAKSICLNFGLPQEYVDAIKRDVHWLGFDWGENLHFASDYFEQLCEWAEHLIRAGNAYVDDSSIEEIRALRGTL